MKKILAFAAGLLLTCSVSFAQVLDSTGVKNTLSTSFGMPYGGSGNTDRHVHLYGLLETLQVRLDVSKFTVEGMLNWGALADWKADGSFDSFTFANTGITPFYYTNHINQGGWWTNGTIESYYVNFLFHPIKGLDLGMGTRLNWVVGPAPSSLDNYWGYKAHIVQGGLKDAVPGGADVAGYTYYANCYTSLYQTNTKAAIAARYRYEDLLEAGISIPSGVTTSAPLFNAAFMIHPVDFLRIGIAYEGILQSNGNLYTGITFGFKNFVLDTYLAANFRTKKAGDLGSRWGTGAAATFTIPKVGIVLRPEIGFSFYDDSNYTLAWYTGARMDFSFGGKYVLGAWSSIAFGSADKRWANSRATANWSGGNVFDIRPDFTWVINKANSLSAYFDFQNRITFKNESYNTWASGFVWTYRK